MMKVDFIASRPDRAGRHTVRFDDGSAMRLYRQTIEDFNLCVDLELSDNEAEKLRIAAGEMSAKMRAVRIVSATGVSEKDLEQRLIHKGEDPEQAKAAVSWMVDLDLIDDRKIAEQIVQRCVSKGYGLSRAKQALYEKRIPKEYWDEVLSDYPDQTDAIVSYLRGRIEDINDPRQLRKVIDSLIRKGHSYSQIRRALDELSVDTDNFPEG
jgi:regulatory protein